MREMTTNERALYNILANNQVARNNNWEAVRMFYWQQYKVNLPDLRELPTVWTIERSIRTLKETYRECSDKYSRDLKKEKEDEFKEKALDKNKPAKTTPKEEQIELVWWDRSNG